MRARCIGAPVVVEHQREVIRRTLPSDGLRKRIDGQLLRDPVRHRPSDDEPSERLPLCLRVRFGPVQAVIVLGFGNAEDLACLPDGTEFAPMRLDELAPHAWS